MIERIVGMRGEMVYSRHKSLSLLSLLPDRRELMESGGKGLGLERGEIIGIIKMSCWWGREEAGSRRVICLQEGRGYGA